MQKIIITALIALIGFSSCNSFDKLRKSNDVNLRLTKANEYYEQGKWYRAKELYEGLLPIFRGTKNHEELYYRYCYTLYNQKQYLGASYQFRNFIEFFPTSTRAEECEYMYGVCLFKDSRNWSLDPTNTIHARDALNNFALNHPQSPHISVVKTYVDVCTQKLEKRDKSAAELYYHMEEYKASKVTFKNLIEKYPDSKDIDYFQYMIVRSNYLYAKGSLEEKQEERYNETIESYKELKDYFPTSKYLKDAEKIHNIAKSKISKIRENGNK